MWTTATCCIRRTRGQRLTYPNAFAKAYTEADQEADGNKETLFHLLRQRNAKAGFPDRRAERTGRAERTKRTGCSGR